jgi:hypothetical protein
VLRLAVPALAALALAAAATPAAASLVITFDYQGSATVGGATSNVNTVKDVNDAERFFSPPDNDLQTSRDRASLINFADDDPFIFANGAATQGTAQAGATLTVTVAITNDTGVAQDFFWQGLIFSGGVGFAFPNFGSESCSSSEIENCSSYLATPFTVQSGERAALQFMADLAGVQLFSADISVDDGGASSTFTGIALENFGAAASNPDFLSWDETTFAFNLGAFAIGETKTLTFEIIVSAETLRGFCTSSTDPDCLLAMAGFGDPPGGGSGGVSQDGGGTARSLAFSILPASEVPLPPAVLLFLAGLGGLAARARRK